MHAFLAADTERSHTVGKDRRLIPNDPIRSFKTASKNFFVIKFKKKIKKWNSVLTFINIPCKFEQDRSKKVAKDVNGLRKLLVFRC